MITMNMMNVMRVITTTKFLLTSSIILYIPTNFIFNSSDICMTIDILFSVKWIGQELIKEMLN